MFPWEGKIAAGRPDQSEENQRATWELVSSTRSLRCRERWDSMPPSRSACSQHRRPQHRVVSKDGIRVDAAAHLLVPNAAPTGIIAAPERSALRTVGAAAVMAPIRGDARAGGNARRASAAWGTGASGAPPIGYATLGFTAHQGTSAAKVGALAAAHRRSGELETFCCGCVHGRT
jgi:hypothetical protein